MRDAHLFSDGNAPIAVKHHKIYHENHKEIGIRVIGEVTLSTLVYIMENNIF